MASPFTVFRRNQKILLAIVGIGAMVAFVFLDPLTRYMSRNSRQVNPVVVQTRYGALTQNELGAMRQSRELVELFLRSVSIETMDAQIAKGLLDGRMRGAAVQQWFSMWQQRLMGRSKLGPDEAAIETLVLSRKAEQLGLVVSDRAINDLLKQITQDSLDSEALQAVMKKQHPGRRISAARLFEAIRTEMLASQFNQLFVQTLRDIPPAQRFECYLRLNRRAKAEIMPLAVVDFVSQVSDPSAEQLKAYYEAHKNQYPDPNSPQPGFKQAKRAAFQYFKADFAQIKERLKPEVTEAEIKEYYEQNKAQFRTLNLPSDKTQEEKPPSEDAAPQTDEAKPTESPKPDGEKPAEPKSPQSSRDQRAATIRLVSATTVDDEKPAEPATPAESQPEKTAPAADAKEGPSEKPAEDKPAEGEATSQAAEEPKYEPLDKVQDTIRESLASQKAAKQIDDIFEELGAAMRRYTDELDRYSVGKETDTRAAAPAPFPFAALAKSKGVEAKELPLVTAAEASAEDIGRVAFAAGGAQAIRSFADFAYSDTLRTYQPNILADNEGNSYLFWKTEEEAAYVPKFEKIRERVLSAWKLVEARNPARKRAEEYAAQARAADKPLAEFFSTQANLKVTDTNSFSWLTMGNVPFDPNAQLRISDVDGVDRVGQEFMEAVFELSPGGVGVAMNHPQDTVYVVRLIEYARSLDELREDFASERQNRYLAVADPERRSTYLAWLADLNRDAGVHWLRKPDATVGRRFAADDAPPDDMDD